MGFDASQMPSVGSKQSVFERHPLAGARLQVFQREQFLTLA
jgi:hypothetical protein